MESRAFKSGQKIAGERRIVAKGKEIELWPSKLRHMKRADIIHPSKGFPLRTMHIFMAEIPPNSYNSKHRHFNEAVIHILSGKGYSVVEGQRYDWEAGDFICVPVFSWHQHFNPDPEVPVRFIGIVNDPLMEALDIRFVEEELFNPKAPDMVAETEKVYGTVNVAPQAGQPA